MARNSGVIWNIEVVFHAFPTLHLKSPTQTQTKLIEQNTLLYYPNIMFNVNSTSMTFSKHSSDCYDHNKSLYSK